VSKPDPDLCWWCGKKASREAAVTYHLKKTKRRVELIVARYESWRENTATLARCPKCEEADRKADRTITLLVWSGVPLFILVLWFAAVGSLLSATAVNSALAVALAAWVWGLVRVIRAVRAIKRREREHPRLGALLKQGWRIDGYS
jgi:Flp pilus assembly protein TadB